MKDKITSPGVRKALYAGSGVVLLILAAVGIIEESAVDSLRDALVSWYDAIIQAIIAGVTFLAAVKTHFGSDDKTTHEDVEVARRQARLEAERELSEGDVEVASHAVSGDSVSTPGRHRAPSGFSVYMD